ncbi:MAG: dihydrodipicolinate synthase family protein [Candidatus Omnitrophota bacterium]|jgi:4-hydroxy-2-oxoglutarate aldolase|nr:MAG: dihydrodipicolinate synthase family protein [Candidatus Omnitrophota bacterium]
MASVKEKLSGVFLPITTPFNEDMRIDYAALKANMAFYAKTEIRGYLVLGSNGENRCLNEEEKREVLETVLSLRDPNQVVMVGCIYDSTVLTVDFMRFVKSGGADFATLLSPSYFRKFMTHDVLVDYFTECAESVDIPVLLYNAPGFTGVTLLPETVGVLSEHPNIVGMKDSAASGIEHFSKFIDADFSVLAGSIGFLYSSMTHGVKGGVASLGNAFPDAAVQLWKYGMRGQDQTGQALQELLKTANEKISGVYGVPGVKAAMDLAGLGGGYPRKPLKRLEGEGREAVRQALIDAGLIS